MTPEQRQQMWPRKGTIVGEAGDHHTIGLFRKSTDQIGFAVLGLEVEHIGTVKAAVELVCLLAEDEGHACSSMSLRPTGLFWCV